MSSSQIGHNQLGQLGQDDIGNLFSKAGLSILGETGTRVVFRSNMTPDITVDISGLMKSKAREAGAEVTAPPPEEVPVSSSDQTLLKVIRPEVRLKVLGNTASYAPYGRPQKSMAIAFVFAIIASILIGAKIAWVICKKV